MITQQTAEALKTELVSELWLKGDVASWYCKPKQRSVVEFLRTTEDPFAEASRRFGKTTSVLSWVLEESILKRRVTRWCEPWKNQCREIVITEMDNIQSRIPDRYRFKWHQTDSYYEGLWNGSRLYLRGVNEDRGESARGAASDIVVADELGSWREPLYVLNEVLAPQLLTTRGKMVFIGTPPRNLTHSYYDLKDTAKEEGRFVQRLIYDQELVPWEEVEKLAKRMGGWQSPAVRRELLCEKIIDTNFAIIPEWNDRFIQDVPRDEFFPFYLKYDGLDIGVRDLSVCPLSYYDFRKGALVVLDEVVMNGAKMTTELLAEAIRAKETEHFAVTWEKETIETRVRWRANVPPHFRMRRVSDIDLLLINDMSAIHGLPFEATDKGSLEEMVNEVRIWVGAGRVIIHPRCKNLIDCLRYGVWDDHRKAWERSDRLGHFDALAALMYIIRNVDVRTNPIPFDYGRPEADYWIDESKKNERQEKMKKLFNVR